MPLQMVGRHKKNQHFSPGGEGKKGRYPRKKNGRKKRSGPCDLSRKKKNISHHQPPRKKRKKGDQGIKKKKRS